MMEKLYGYFHGTLTATISHATSSTPSFPNCHCILLGRSAYVTIEINKTKVAETRHDSDLTWNQTFHILCAHPSDSTVTITLRTGFSVLGVIRIPALAFLIHQRDYCSSLPLLNGKGKPRKKLKLKFSLGFSRATESESPYWGLVHGVSFPERENCSVVLYQDAHHERSFQPPIGVGNRGMYKPRRLWEDVFMAIDGAEQFIYIVGWSLNPKMVLVRDPETEIQRARGIKLGKLLKRKAEEGVVVRIMLWDDETSLPIIRNEGLMRTHDRDALAYFANTKVVCKLCPRLHLLLPTVFAHHQKTITVDTATKTSSSSREILSFIGGLDLCDGRYDTEQHSLFRTLNSKAHASDFYQINIAGARLNRGGPREPWHDVHACVRGEAARDILTNFEQRWAKQCGKIQEIPSFVRDGQACCSIPAQPSVAGHLKEQSRNLAPQCQHNVLPSSSTNSNATNQYATLSVHPDNWNVQVFRSIDKTSAIMPNKCSVEHSIHEAYVQAIRRANNFIYIENQYFVGGCHLWSKERDSGCENLIPVEIALKVASKIRAGERFAVYIVVPMWPEGVPTSETVQDILNWSRLTMEMMYRVIGEAIEDSGTRSHPRDYLNFFCLANREEKRWGEYVPPSSPPRTSHYWRAQKNRRFMIYVHSKLMIVDDEYLLIGSANVNQRSMDGQRDTEIAIGCYQPNCVGKRHRNNGEIHTYRLSLWYEHTAQMNDAFLNPKSLDCVRNLQIIGEEMWGVYSSEPVDDMAGVHLVSYPINVSVDGVVEDLVSTFPDTTSLIKGRRSNILPPVCTT